jgi:hypothetical protein
LSQKSTKTHVSIIYTIIKKCLIEWDLSSMKKLNLL